MHIVTDTTASAKNAGREIETRHPHISYSPCQAHCIDLLLEDIGKDPAIAPLLKLIHDVQTFIRRHQASLAIFRKFSPLLHLLKVGASVQHAFIFCVL